MEKTDVIIIGAGPVGPAPIISASVLIIKPVFQED